MPINMASAGKPNGNKEPPKRVWPVFFKSKDIPLDLTKGWITTAEICKTVEGFTGHDSMYAAQRCGGLWRLYAKDERTRMTLLTQGLELRGVAVTLYDKNPFIIRESDEGSVQETTRLVVGQIPLSYSNEDILKSVQALGVKIMSQMQDEHDRDERGQLTRWKTGNRFVYIVVPEKNLPKKIKVGNFTATLFHKEQKIAERRERATCNRCLEMGHVSRECAGPLRCRACHGENHKEAECPDNMAEESDQAEVPMMNEVTADMALISRRPAAVEQSTPRAPRAKSLPRNQRIDNMLQKIRTEANKKILHSPPTPPAPENDNKKQKVSQNQKDSKFQERDDET